MTKTFALFFTVVMLAICGYVLAQGFSVDRLDQQIVHERTDLNTNRQRERKQQVEYDRAAAELPENQKRLAEIKPEAEAAKATETELRSQRKQLRGEVADLKTAVESAEADAIQAEQHLQDAEEQYGILRTEAEALLEMKEGGGQP